MMSETVQNTIHGHILVIHRTSYFHFDARTSFEDIVTNVENFRKRLAFFTMTTFHLWYIIQYIRMIIHWTEWFIFSKSSRAKFVSRVHWVNAAPKMYKASSVKRDLNAFANSIDSCQLSRTAQAGMNRYYLLSVSFRHVKGPVHLLMQSVVRKKKKKKDFMDP